jgi:putative nucleotidyltransferase with HDIG domain
LARSLAEALRDHTAEPVDVEVVEAAALLHDIAKGRCLETGGDHSVEGGRLLKRLGFAEIASLVEQHVILARWDPEGRVHEAEILNYSDKRVLHEDVVSLQERLRDLIIRYGRGNPAAEAAIQANGRAIEAMERKIFSRLPFGPEKLAEVGEERLHSAPSAGRKRPAG